MLPQLQLDDRWFDQLVQEARKSIPKYMPDWTDENAHDPGITFIELFAWLTEMQQFYLNQITAHSERKFLKLLGYKTREAVSAAADVTFGNHAGIVVIPQGTKLNAHDQAFETAAALTYIPARIERIIVRTETEANDYTSSNDNEGVSYYAFGREAKTGSRMYVAFSQELPIGEEIVLTIHLFEDYPVQRGAHSHDRFEFENASDSFIPSAKVSWKVYGKDEQQSGSASWINLDLIEDGTLQLSRSGQIRFRLKQQMRPIMIHPANDMGRYWICCTVEQSGYELPPKIRQISLNTVKALQQNTFSEVIGFDSSGEADQTVVCRTHLAHFGTIRVQIQEQLGQWVDWQEQPEGADADAQPDSRIYRVDRNPHTCETFVRFTSKIPAAGHKMIRVIAFSEDFKYTRNLGSSNGLPGQSFVLYDMSIIPDSLLIQIGRGALPDGSIIWEDWRLVEDFDNSRADDRHYVYDCDRGEFRFGNNENGLIPGKSAHMQICIIACRTGGGTRGNVKRNLIDEIADIRPAAPGLTVTNHFFAEGGLERESLEETKVRMQKSLNRPTRAITAEDYETIARSTPGLRVARVKALPLYEVGLKNYPHAKAPAQMTVVVVPYSEVKTPIPSGGFLQSVKNHLDEHRLITTEVHVIPPEYIKITVHAVVVVEPNATDDAPKIVAALNELLQPLASRNGTNGWDFGRTVYKGDLYGTISRIAGVSYIQDIWLNAEGRNIRRSAGGDIQIPPYGLVYSGEHEIEMISRTDI